MNHSRKAIKSLLAMSLPDSVEQSPTCVKKLSELQFDNRALKSLPLDPETKNYVRSVKNACFSLVSPTPLKNPRLVVHSTSALRLIDLDDESVTEDGFVDAFAGNRILDGSQTAAHCYCGHQFGELSSFLSEIFHTFSVGSFAGQLGDGAAIYLGEVVNSRGERWELQLKGAGLTPYSRMADGRKVLRSSLREFLCSEAMHHLGIPTTRAATCIVGDDQVERDMFYDGNARMESCTVILRLAQTFIRFGSFEIIKPLDRNTGHVGPSVGRKDILTKLVDFVISSYYPEIDKLEKASREDKIKAFYKEVVQRTAKVCALWQTVGFCHGVLNSDNMSIVGLTLDYGPFGFMDRFSSDFVPNTSDREGRYCFQQQPFVCGWNLVRLAEVLNNLVPIGQFKDILNASYHDAFVNAFNDRMMKKFGLVKRVEDTENGKWREDADESSVACDEKLIGIFMQTLEDTGGDYTNCFRCLSQLRLPGSADFDNSFIQTKTSLMAQSSTWEEMMDYYDSYIKSPMVYLRILMRDRLGEQSDDLSVLIMHKLERYQRLKQMDHTLFRIECERHWTHWLYMYVGRLQHELGSSQTHDLDRLNRERVSLMNKHNPRYVLRNYLAEEAIQKAEKGDFSEAKRLLRALENPFDELEEFDDYTRKPPANASKIRVSCSS